LPSEPPSLFSFSVVAPVSSGPGNGYRATARFAGPLLAASVAHRAQATGREGSSGTESGFPLSRYFADAANPLLRHWLDDDIPFFRNVEGRFPLVLFGPPGVGKTVLACSLAHRLGGKVLALAVSEFVRLYGEACETRSVPWFRQSLDAADILVIDSLDIASLAESAASELVRLVDHYLELQRPILVTMAASPFASSGEHASLVSRLAGGLSIEVGPPGREARAAIIRQLCLHCELPVEENAIPWLVNQLPDDVPGMQREFYRILLEIRRDRSLATKSPLGRVDLAGLVTASGSDPLPVPLTLVTRVVARHFRMKVADLAGRGRQRNRVLARSVAAWLARTVYSLSYARIGLLLGKRDASTIRHACDSIEAARSRDPVLEHVLLGLARQLRESRSAGGKAMTV
jgi:chromosomal replication initiator protein